MKTLLRSSRRLTSGPENALALKRQISYSLVSNTLLRWRVESARLKDKAMAPISVMPCWANLPRLPQPPLSQEIFKTLTQYYNAGIAFLACLNGIQNRFIMAGDCIHSTKLRTTQRYCVWRIKRSCLLSQTWQHIEWHNFCHYTASKKGATCPKSS